MAQGFKRMLTAVQARHVSEMVRSIDSRLAGLRRDESECETRLEEIRSRRARLESERSVYTGGGLGEEMETFAEVHGASALDGRGHG